MTVGQLPQQHGELRKEIVMYRGVGHAAPQNQMERRAWPSSPLCAQPVRVDIEAGVAVRPEERAYAWTTVGDLCRHNSTAVWQGRVHLYATVDAAGQSVAIADATFILDDALVTCVHAIARDMHDAIDKLASRLRRRWIARCEKPAASA